MRRRQFKYHAWQSPTLPVEVVVLTNGTDATETANVPSFQQPSSLVKLRHLIKQMCCPRQAKSVVVLLVVATVAAAVTVKSCRFDRRCSPHETCVKGKCEGKCTLFNAAVLQRLATSTSQKVRAHSIGECRSCGVDVLILRQSQAHQGWLRMYGLIPSIRATHLTFLVREKYLARGV